MQEEAEGFAMTRAQGKKEVAKAEEVKKGEVKSREGESMKTGTHQPAYRREPKIADPQMAQQILNRILDVEVLGVKIHELLALESGLRKQIVDLTRTQNAPTVGAAMVSAPEVAVDFATPLQEVDVVVMGKCQERGLLDEGSEIMIVREDLCGELGLEVSRDRKMMMQTANGGKEEMLGCVEYLEIEVGGVKTYAHAFVARKAPFWLLLGRPWQKGVKLGKVERGNGGMDVEITDPGDEEQKVVVPTRERKGGRLRSGLMVLGEGSETGVKIEGGEDTLTDTILSSTFTYDADAHCLAYKKVANKVLPVPGTMPDDIRIICRFPEDPLDTLPQLASYPPPFLPGERLTEERMEVLGLMKNEFLWLEERKLVAKVLVMSEKALAWDESEKGRFRDAYFSPVKIPVQEHVPWA